MTAFFYSLPILKWRENGSCAYASVVADLGLLASDAL